MELSFFSTLTASMNIRHVSSLTTRGVVGKIGLLLVCVPISQAAPPSSGWQPPSVIRSNQATQHLPAQIRATPNAVVDAEAPEVADLRTFNALQSRLHLRAGQQPSLGDRAALAQTFRAIQEVGSVEEGALKVMNHLKQFKNAHATSPLASSVNVEIGRRAALLGDFPAAMSSWKAVWEAWRDVTDDPEMVRLADEACGRLAHCYRRTGQKVALEQLLRSVQGRAFTYPGSALMTASRLVLKEWQSAPQSNVQCGVVAYNQLAEKFAQQGMLHRCSVGEDDPYKDPNEDEADFVLHGMSALVLRNRSVEAGWPMKVIKRVSGSSLPVPCIAHFSWGPDSGHFSAFVEANERSVEIKDTFLGLQHRVPVSVINPQLSGYFLIPESNPLPAGFDDVSPAEAAFVYGRGDDSTDSQNLEGDNPKECGKCSEGMAVHNFTTYLPGLVLEDTPLTYTPRYGPVPNLTLEYRQIDTLNGEPADAADDTTHISPLWRFQEVSYLRAADLSTLPTLNTPGLSAVDMRWVNGDGSYYNYTGTGAQHAAARYAKSRPGLFFLYSQVGQTSQFRKLNEGMLYGTGLKARQ